MNLNAVTTVTSGAPTAASGIVTFEVADPASIPVVPCLALHYPQLRNDSSGVTRGKQLQAIVITALVGNTATATVGFATTGRSIGFGDVIDCAYFALFNQSQATLDLRSNGGVDIGVSNGPTSGSRRNTLDGSDAAPVSGTHVTAPTDYISRNILTGDTYDFGAINVVIKSQAGGVAQVTGFQGFIDQFASADACVIQNQVVMENVGGAAFGLGYSNTSNVAHTCTISHASPAVITCAGHGLTLNHGVRFNSVGGTLPTGITAGTIYYVISAGLTANTFRVSTSLGGSAVNTSSDGTGTFYVTGNSIWGYNPVLINSSNVPLDYDGAGQVVMSAIIVQPLSTTRGGNALRVLGNSGGPLSEGIVFDALSIHGQSIWDASSSAEVLHVENAHTFLINYSAATLTYFMAIGAGDNTDPTGGGGAATGRIPINVNGATRWIPYYT